MNEGSRPCQAAGSMLERMGTLTSGCSTSSMRDSGSGDASSEPIMLPTVVGDFDSGYNRLGNFEVRSNAHVLRDPTGPSTAFSGACRERDMTGFAASDRRSDHGNGNHMPESNSNLNSRQLRLGHSFFKRTLHKPACCHHCGEVIWGLISTGFQCEFCNLLAHERCHLSVYSSCTSVAPLHVKFHTSHCWSDPVHFKRKFCNVCRKRLEDTMSVRCEVCEYYCHVDCQDYAVNDCKRGASFQPGKPMFPPPQTHHWREGNLPPNSKCAHCRKTCWSSECLTGYRCQWCGLTAHASCVPQLSDKCDFGPLRDIMLPAQCVSLPRPTTPIEHIIGITKRPRSRTLSEEWSSSGDSKEDSWQDHRSPRETVDLASSDEYVCVFDGIGGLRRHSWRSFTFSKTMSTYSVVKRCLKAFHLAGTPEIFNVYEVNDRDGRENKLNTNVNFRSQLLFDAKQPSIVLRVKEPEEMEMLIKVYAGDLRNILPPNASDYEEVWIDSSTTSADCLNIALEKFGCGHLGSDDCYLSSVCMDRQVYERRLADDELLVPFFSQLRQESARTSQLTRLELRFVVDDAAGSHAVSLFVGNLKENLSQRLYECILLEKLGEEYRWDTIDAIYYESGCLVLTYRASEKAERAYDLLKDAMLMDKQLTALLLPTIHPRHLPEGVQPLLVFVNLKSGGCQGLDLIVAFRRLLNPFQVFNLDYGGPLPGLYCFRHLSSYKILICGGDGTVGWTLSCLDIVGQDAACNSPPIAPLPLGTGNDLARVLRWGSGYSSTEDPLSILKDVVAAEEVQLDRWTFVVRPAEEFKDETKLALETQNNAPTTNEENSIMIIMNSYFGIGIDADLSLDFHNARSENPSKFNSRIHNKGVYFKIGLRKMMNRTACKDLHKQIVVVADGKLLTLPPIEGLIVLNIHSWGGGANPWGLEKDDVFSKPTHYDGLLEVVGISGVVHMGQIYSGLGSGIRLAQAGHVRKSVRARLCVPCEPHSYFSFVISVEDPLKNGAPNSN
ncbi:diacylglycerol kinase [Clonorchis sinensis]|uniref:Diacylglycerol kinase n=2 Tax=Clonorchis sinensis TaxID=79923 RepID=H2KPF4_CLOSI|nr:diacylglycerol kinase [Clonorchis sinensis]